MRQLSLRGEPEVLGRGLEDVPADLGRDGQAFQVDETRGLEATEDRDCGRLALLGVSVQEGREVDELLFIYCKSRKRSRRLYVGILG